MINVSGPIGPVTGFSSTRLNLLGSVRNCDYAGTALSLRDNRLADCLCLDGGTGGGIVQQPSSGPIKRHVSYGETGYTVVAVSLRSKL